MFLHKQAHILSDRIAEDIYALPGSLISPILMMWGQCWRVFAKKGFVTPRITDGLEEQRQRLKQDSKNVCLNEHKRSALT